MSACGDTFTVAVDVDGRLCAVGLKLGPAWRPDGDMRCMEPQAFLQALANYESASDTAPFTAPYMPGGARFGKCTPRRAVLVAARQAQCMALLSDGSILSSTRDRIGHHPPAKWTWHCSREFSEPVASIACGERHMVAVTQAGRVHVQGFPRRTASQHWRFSMVTQPPAFLATTVVFAAAGDEHTSCVGSDGSTWTWGEGGEGVLGHGDALRRSEPTRIVQTHFHGRRVAMTAGGADHAAAITECGVLYMWGSGNMGQLGVALDASVHTPTVFFMNDALAGASMRSVACGYTHTVATTDEGACWEWGTSTAECLRLPHRVAFGEEPQPAVVSVAAGVAHSTAVLGDGRLFTWAPNTGLQFGATPGLIRLGARVGCFHGLPAASALAFAMGCHADLARPLARRSLRARGRPPTSSLHCAHSALPPELVRRIVEACVWSLEGAAAATEGTRRLAGAPP